MQASLVLTVAGVLVWALSGLRVVFALVQRGPDPRTLFDVAVWATFLVAFLAHGRCATRRGALAALAAQSFTALVLALGSGGEGVEMALVVVVAGQLRARLPMSVSFAWIAATSLVTTVPGFVGATTAGARIAAVMTGLAYLSFQLFALGAAALAESERQTREQLALANAELERMQAIAVAGARQAERLRIARDLHDSLGHRLTALGLTLEAARHLPPDDAVAKIGEGRVLASQLMADLRRAVGEIRDDETPELRALFDGLARSVEAPRVSTDIDPALRITSPDAATALYRIGQEIVTNAARHSDARNVRLSVRAIGDSVEMEGFDDGAAADAGDVAPGNGLTGIRERARLLGGDATFARVPGRGFRVTARFPAARLA